MLDYNLPNNGKSTLFNRLGTRGAVWFFNSCLLINSDDKLRTPPLITNGISFHTLHK